MSAEPNHLFYAVSAFFVNEFYHKVYNVAKCNKRGSLTETYQDKITNYIRGIKSVEKIFTRLCTDIHRYVTKSSRFLTLMYTELIDKLVSSCTPHEYFEILSKDQKDEIFSSIINDLAATLGAFCLKPNILRKIIDEHETSKTITEDILFREANNILISKQEELRYYFIQNIGQSKNMVSAQIVAEYQRQIEDLNKEIHELRSENSDLQYTLEDKEKKIEFKDDQIHKYKRMLELILKRNKNKPSPPSVKEIAIPTVLTTENLKKHLEINSVSAPMVNMKDEDSKSSEEDIIGRTVVKQINKKDDDNKTISTEKSILDNIDGLLLVD